MIEWVNLTGHVIRVYDKSGRRVRMTIYPANTIARIIQKVKKVEKLEGIPIVDDELVEVTGLPEPRPNTVYIVSTPVLEFLWMKGICRKDVVAPDTGPDSVVRVRVKGGWKKVGVRRFRRLSCDSRPCVGCNEEV